VLAAEKEPESRERAYLYIAGYLTADGKATFDPFQMIFSKRAMSTKLIGKAYDIVLEGKNGLTRSEFRFEPKSVINGGGNLSISLW
jgi:hypothetical protein